MDFYLELKEEEKERARQDEDNSDVQRNLRAMKLAHLGQSAKALKKNKQKSRGGNLLKVLSKKLEPARTGSAKEIAVTTIDMESEDIGELDEPNMPSQSLDSLDRPLSF